MGADARRASIERKCQSAGDAPKLAEAPDTATIEALKQRFPDDR